MTLTPAGELLSIEREIALADLPEPASAALKARYPRATRRVVEEIVEVRQGAQKPADYELVLATADRNMLEVLVPADGRILEEEQGADDQDDGP